MTAGPRRPARTVRNVALVLALSIYLVLIIRFLVLSVQAGEWVGVVLAAGALGVAAAGTWAIWFSRRPR